MNASRMGMTGVSSKGWAWGKIISRMESKRLSVGMQKNSVQAKVSGRRLVEVKRSDRSLEHLTLLNRDPHSISVHSLWIRKQTRTDWLNKATRTKWLEQTGKRLVRSWDYTNSGISLNPFVEESVDLNFQCSVEDAIKAKTRVNRWVCVHLHWVLNKKQIWRLCIRKKVKFPNRLKKTEVSARGRFWDLHLRWLERKIGMDFYFSVMA